MWDWLRIKSLWLTLLAISKASTFGCSLIYAFFLPSGLHKQHELDTKCKVGRTNLIKVLTLSASTSCIFLIASLTWRLFALRSTKKTRVLTSSIFFIACSVFKGCNSTLYSYSAISWQATRETQTSIDLDEDQKRLPFEHISVFEATAKSLAFWMKSSS